MTGMMRAAVLPDYNKPLEIREIPIPRAAAGEVIVKVAASGVCHSDLTLSAHQAPNDLGSMPWVLGHENAGYVHEIGEGVAGFEPGDAVAVHCGQGCGHCTSCRRGEEHLCAESWSTTGGPRLIGVELPGGFAEYVRVPSTRTLVKLDGLDPVDAAPLTDAGVTAYGAVQKALPALGPGSTVIVFGVGGVGAFAVRYLRELSAARIVVVARSETSRELALSIGADLFVYSGENTVADLHEIVGSEGAAAIIDFVGSETTTAQSFEAISAGGRIILVGIGSGKLTIDWSTKPQVSAITSYMASMDGLREIIWLARERGITADIVRYPLDQAQQALDDLAERKFTGRAVLIP